MKPAVLMCFFWRGNPLYFVLRLLISSPSPLRSSEIQTLRRLSLVLAFLGAPNYVPIQCLIYMYIHVPPKSCYWRAPFFAQLLPARPCLICPCYLKMRWHYLMDLTPFNKVTLSFETSETIYLATRYHLPEDHKHHGFHRMVMSDSSQTSWRHRIKWQT
jgi:hypothetical protein